MNSLEGAVRRRWHIADAAVSRDGMTISGLDWGGDGPIALLQHANGFCAASLAPLAQLLRRHYRVIAIDARGHGDSGQPPLPEGVRWKRFADDLAATARQILDETGRERIDYGIGSSFGGTCTAIAEARHPNTFARIAMLDPPVRPNEAWLKKMGLDPAVARSDGPGLAEQAKKRRESWPSREAVRHAWKDKPTFQSWTPEAFELYLNEGFKDLPDGSVALKCPPAVEAAVFAASAAEIDMYDAVTAVACPALLVHASQGHFPVVFHELFAGQFQNGVHRVVNAAHLMPLEAPALCAELLFEFAGQPPSTASSTASSAASASIP